MSTDDLIDNALKNIDRAARRENFGLDAQNALMNAASAQAMVAIATELQNIRRAIEGRVSS